MGFCDLGILGEFEVLLNPKHPSLKDPVNKHPRPREVSGASGLGEALLAARLGRSSLGSRVSSVGCIVYRV